VPRAVLFDLEPGVIGAVPRNRRYPALQTGQPREPYARSKTGTNFTTEGSSANYFDSPPLIVAVFAVNSKHHTGARPSVRLYVEPELARCVHLPWGLVLAQPGGHRLGHHDYATRNAQ
jgi:hypothetical protein